MKTLEQILADPNFTRWFSQKYSTTVDEIGYWNEELLFPFYEQYQLELRKPPEREYQEPSSQYTAGTSPYFDTVRQQDTGRSGD